MPSEEVTPPAGHTVAVVVPVYRGEDTLPLLLDEIDALTAWQASPDGARFRVSEVVLVHDAGPDRSDETIRALASRYHYVRPVWLARNFGQHDPQAIGLLLDTALATRSPLVYARPTNTPPHGVVRNLTSSVAHSVARVLGAGDLGHFHSFRLVLGEVGRGLAAYCGEGVYLDVALSWVARRTATRGIAMRDERGRPSGYSLRTLASHFWRMVLTSGTRPLRLVALFGALLGVGALVLVAFVVWAKVTNHVPVQGWTSVMVILLVTSGGILFSLGIVAEYLGIAARMAMGKPLYLVVTDPAEGALGRTSAPPAEHDDEARTSEPSARIEA
jgi:polyisoprenyl-phosphate glycosyltransferase